MFTLIQVVKTEKNRKKRTAQYTFKREQINEIQSKGISTEKWFESFEDGSERGIVIEWGREEE